jgi:phosphoribosyl-ATP pyrophosphohydrolase
MSASFNLHDLERTIAVRAGVADGSSHTGTLIASGMEKCARKLGEEAIETVIAAISGDKTELRKEAADLIYHLLVVLKAGDLPLDEVLRELGQRTGQSGVAEKAARKAGS